MFSNVGKTLKNMAWGVLAVGILASLVLGLMAWYGFILVFGVGFLLSWITGAVLYGLGQAVENSDKCVAILASAYGVDPDTLLKNEPEPAHTKGGREPWTCFGCGSHNSGSQSYCPQCHGTRGWSDAQWEKKKK